MQSLYDRFFSNFINMTANNAKATFLDKSLTFDRVFLIHLLAKVKTYSTDDPHHSWLAPSLTSGSQTLNGYNFFSKLRPAISGRMGAFY